MATSFADTAIAVLIDLAERGEIDPWDVQVVDVFDRCLQELATGHYQDLHHSGQAFLYAAILILLKSDSLLGLEQAEPTLDFEEAADEHLVLPGLPVQLERHLQRRPVAPPPQRRRVTLAELIDHLKTMAVEVEKRTVNRPPRPTPVRRRPSNIKAITQLAHQENLTEMAHEVEALLQNQGLGEEWLDLEALLTLKNDRVGVFWALLFLSSQSKVELDQAEFYQDLRIRIYQADLLPSPVVASA
ncbi:segregation/condensation protein A [Synechococcus sp. PCC 6312]|uniref:segregation/condensation protein A n=1 Tax=Synechococcus sp. (strain ATCC 27167 / PCC 6312) TaxID=195253 RepID=UPI00029F4DC8|nr:segregation/condensation protein A [Synechococcus sp. PCC 6312]AFY62331.1 hypothetical protein Syn6312_3289 [Synechococcus sp. PCC 6312]